MEFGVEETLSSFVERVYRHTIISLIVKYSGLLGEDGKRGTGTPRPSLRASRPTSPLAEANRSVKRLCTEGHRGSAPMSSCETLVRGKAAAVLDYHKPGENR